MINAMLAEAQARVTTPKIQRIGSLTILSCTIAAAIAISQRRSLTDCLLQFHVKRIFAGLHGFLT